VTWLPLDASLFDAIPERPSLSVSTVPGGPRPDFVRGVHGSALRPGPSGADLDVSMLTSTSYTLTFWIALVGRPGTAGARPIMRWGGGQLDAVVRADGRFDLVIDSGSTATIPNLDGTRFHHVAMVVTAGAPTLVEPFVDGTSAGGGGTIGVMVPLGPTVHLEPAADFDDLRIYDRALTPAQITALATP
jgi:hypothetical protein